MMDKYNETITATSGVENVAPNVEKQAYSVGEFCRRYSISRATFYREVMANRLSILKCGRRTLIRRHDAERWLESLGKG